MIQHVYCRFRKLLLAIVCLFLEGLLAQKLGLVQTLEVLMKEMHAQWLEYNVVG